jgi:hypothetical protein
MPHQREVQRQHSTNVLSAPGKPKASGQPRYPQGPVWPEEMAADMAAAYLDEPSVAAFESKVGTIWPLPDRRRGSRRKWSRELLLQAVRERHGVLSREEHERGPEKVSDLI